MSRCFSAALLIAFAVTPILGQPGTPACQRDSSVCRIHAEWTVAAGTAKLVLWQEVVDCSKRGSAREYRTILDRR